MFRVQEDFWLHGNEAQRRRRVRTPSFNLRRRRAGTGSLPRVPSGDEISLFRVKLSFGEVVGLEKTQNLHWNAI